MERPTCVVDASTLVEHIQEIKRWTQQGRLCLVVPLSSKPFRSQIVFCFADLTLAVDNVKIICDREFKLREQQLYALQPQKPNGKPNRREQPLYDNNPRVTLEFLNRVQAEGGHGLIFQRQGEEYSPWQRHQSPPPRQVQEERPATFAEAVRHKLNATNGTSGAPGASKGNNFPYSSVPQAYLLLLALGPAKAKLVARASTTDMSPWKTNKSAPRTSADLVPVALRPLLSYTLWRLYEERNTQGVGHPCMLLTNDIATYNVAQMLTICVGTISQIRQLIASQTKVEDLDAFGELEREFGRRGPFPKPDPNWRSLRPEARKADGRNAEALVANKDHVLDGSMGDQKDIADEQKGSTREQIGDVDIPESQVVVHSISDGDVTIKDTETGVSEVEGNLTNMEEPPIVSQDRKSVQQGLTKVDSAVRLSKIEDIEQAGLTHIGHEKLVGTPCLVEVSSTQIEKEINQQPANSSTSKFQPADRQGDEWQVKKDVIDTSVLASDLSTNEKPAPMTTLNGVSRSTDSAGSATPQQAETQNLQCSSPSAASSGSLPYSPRPSSGTNSLSATEGKDQEDSDEEVVVFNPRAKRWSSQSKPVKEIGQSKSPAKPSSSRTLAPGFESPPRERSSDRVPMTPSPSSHAQMSLLPPNQSPRNQKSGAQSPRSQVHHDQARIKQGPQIHSPRNMSPRNHSPRNQVQRKQGRPNQAAQNRAPPAIIDPNFFGRSAVVNLNPNGQNGQGRYSHHGGPRRGPRGHEEEVEYVLTSGATREATRGKGKLWVP